MNKRGIHNTPAFGALRVIGVLAIMSTGGCQLVGGGGSGGGTRSEAGSMPVPHGTYEGFMEIEGGRVNGTLTIRPTGGTGFDGSFESLPDLMASGQGRMRGQEFRLDLSYEGQCPGRMRMVGRLEISTGDLTGSVRASDCTGDADGTFLFRPG